MINDKIDKKNISSEINENKNEIERFLYSFSIEKDQYFFIEIERPNLFSNDLSDSKTTVASAEKTEATAVGVLL